MSDVQLQLNERIISGIELGESHFREFKTALERRGDGSTEPRNIKEVCRDIAEVLVAFANSDGAELFIGVENDGSITGIPHKPELVEMMKNAHSNYVHPETPLPPPVIRQLSVDGRLILYFRISNSSDRVHLTSEGRCLKRFDRENRPVSAERIQYDRQEVISREYDRAFVPNCTVQDLDLSLLDDIATKRLSLGHSPEKLLQFLDLAEFGTDGLKIRRAALLLFAKDIIQWHPR